jgi:hypothetical protein
MRRVKEEVLSESRGVDVDEHCALGPPFQSRGVGVESGLNGAGEQQEAVVAEAAARLEAAVLAAVGDVCYKYNAKMGQLARYLRVSMLLIFKG